MNFTERILYAITAAIAVGIGIFMYLEMTSIERYSEFSPFEDQISIIDETKELEISAKNVDFMPPNPSEKLTNTVTDVNDNRKASYEDYSANMKDAGYDGEKSALDAQKRFQEEASSSSYNQEVRKIIEERKKSQQNDSKNKTSTSNNAGGTKSENKFAGKTLVSYDLNGRYPFQNNDWNVRNPGYTCGHDANGTVVIRIKVNKNGNVIEASYDAGSSSGANECMIQQGLKYAKMSRFDYSGSAPEAQSGKIYYSFSSQ